VELLSSIGYEPTISLESDTDIKRKVNRSLIYKVAVAGFAFGNIMLLSFPEYFQTDGFWLEKYRPLFRTIIFITSLPVVFYAATDYFVSAYKGLKHKILNIDVPIALGISVLFLRSSYEILFNVGQGYFDSLSGFVFFLLVGKIFQEHTYNFLSFERDYKSYFPIAVTKINEDKTESIISIHNVQRGDRLLIRNKELIPVDGILISKSAEIDYSFVTGESLPVLKRSGDKIFAGGKQLTEAVEMEVLQSITQSYLTQLWNNDVFNNDKISKIKNLTDSISKQFTIMVLIIAFLSGVYWYFKDVTMVANVVTAVLIVACPCALALSAPFALGNMLRILGKRKMYLKNTEVIENLARIDTIIFDKTGTITTNSAKITYTGKPLSFEEKTAIASVLRNSNHPLSRKIYSSLNCTQLDDVISFKEIVGQGIQAIVNQKSIKIGSSKFVGASEPKSYQTKVYISIDDLVLGKFIFKNSYRNQIRTLFNRLIEYYHLGILSGDNEGEKVILQKLLPSQTELTFNQTPNDKLNYIQAIQDKGGIVLMIGDGLNDAGALKQSDVGLVITDDINVFSPASDGIIDASKFSEINELLRLSKKTLGIIKISFVISLLYNVIGMYFAINGLLSPIIAAILMPLSSVTIVIFVTIATNFEANRKKYKT
ncbi:MAG: HAD-IC family P-type ATPase, partial [Flavobacteriaceae bacterium]|nr:HAD-IC family P-type ATPase [Flavobacteriaceae bacterium]